MLRVPARGRTPTLTASAIGVVHDAGLPPADLGAIWCPEITISEVTRRPEVVARVCQRQPWYRTKFTREHSYNHTARTWQTSRDAAPRTAGAVYLVRATGAALQLLFGLHGATAYLAPTLAGCALGAHIHTRGGVSWRLLAAAAACISAAACVGVRGLYLLRKKAASPGAFPEQVAEDALERGASQVRGEESLASSTRPRHALDTA